MDELKSLPPGEYTNGLRYPMGRNQAPECGEVIRAAAGVYWFHMPLPISLARINLWLLQDGDGWVVVDTGMNSPEALSAWETAFETHLKGMPVKRVIVTHMHPDHIGMAGWLTRRFDCDLWISRTEFMMCHSLVADTGKEAPKEAIEFYRAAGFSDQDLQQYRKRFGNFGAAIGELPRTFHRLVDGQTFEVNRRQWQVVVGSGHSPEHVCLYCPELGVLISGDQVLPRISSNVSVFPMEPAADPLTEWLDSCDRLRRQLPDDLLVLPSHQEPFYGLHARLGQLIDTHEEDLQQLHAFLAEPKRAIDCFSVLFKRKISTGLMQFAIGETLAHLNCLLGRDLILCEPDAQGVSFYRQA